MNTIEIPEKLADNIFHLLSVASQEEPIRKKALTSQSIIIKPIIEYIFLICAEEIVEKFNFVIKGFYKRNHSLKTLERTSSL